MKNIVICQINSKYIHSSLAAWCILAGIRKYCESRVSASVCEGTVNESEEAIAARISEKSPDIVGFSSYIWNIGAVEKTALAIKRERPETVIILGGPEVSYSPVKALENFSFADFIVCGEGEYPFARLADAVAEGKDVSDIPGIAYRKDREIFAAEPYLPSDIPPSPYTREYFDALRGRIAYLETSRGCPYSCAFCLSGRCGKMRFFPEERAKKELLMLAGTGTKTVKLVDRTFNADRRRADRFYSFISENYGTRIPSGVRVHFEISAKLLDDESFETIKRLPRGAVQFEVGIQSFNKRTLAAISRDTDVETAEQKTRRLISLGNVHVHTDLIAGLPFEDYSSFAESFNRAFAMRPQMLQLGFLKILSGSEMGDENYPYKCVFSLEPPYEVRSTEWLSERDISRLRIIEDLNDRLYNSGRFINTLDLLLASSGKTPFELYEKLADSLRYGEKTGLDDFTKLFFEACLNFDGVDKKAVFDALVCDRLSSVADGRLPPFLKTDYEKTAELKKRLLAEKPELYSKGVKRAIAYLSSQGRGVYVNYNKLPDPVTGRYEIEYV